ncbi:phospholipase A and acyltransferase 3-like isoform X2 [Ahaetulla prasina]|uniref:phospholipase A and acyltransferase 3-like isoform X2 n=1 Tax=Ahaetulla prasina TaxID=499056 RepID=UPI002649244E|nr:phospholipase A and acyltransferase 3-like isoform X2 [Ahaetulla prasina]
MTNKASWTGEVDLELGDLIEIFRRGYQHWAVYVGLGNVVHLAPPSEYAGAGAASFKSLWADAAMVKKEQLSNVVGTDRYRVSNKHDSRYTVRTADQIISLANDLEGKIVEYKITSQNCPVCDPVRNGSSFAPAARLKI